MIDKRKREKRKDKREKIGLFGDKGGVYYGNLSVKFKII